MGFPPKCHHSQAPCREKRIPVFNISKADRDSLAINRTPFPNQIVDNFVLTRAEINEIGGFG